MMKLLKVPTRAGPTIGMDDSLALLSAAVEAFFHSKEKERKKERKGREG